MLPPPLRESADAKPDFDAIDAARRKARRHAWLIVFGVFGVVFILFAVAFLSDEAPPDTSDLVVPRKNLPAEQNAYAQLTNLVATLPPDPNENTPEETHYARIFENEVAWNTEVVAAVLSRYPPSLPDSVRAALNAPDSEAPEIKSYADLIPEVGRFRALANTLTRQAALAWRSGDHAKAAELNLLALQLGARVSQSGGTLITVLTGAAIENIALESIQRHADAETASPDTLRNYLARLRPHEVRIEDYFIAYKLEHPVFANTARDLHNQQISGLSGAKPHKALNTLMCLPGIWQPNRTIRWHAEFIRLHVNETEPAAPGAPQPGKDHVQSIVDAPWPGRVHNFTGRVFLAIAAPTLAKVTTQCHRARARLRLTELYVAIRLHHLEHGGALPDDLAGLAPAYFPALPLDPFDGQPLRYDRTLTTIWSTDQERIAVTAPDGDLPKGMPAYRLRFARPPEPPLPTFAEFTAEQNGETSPVEISPGETPPPDVSPVK